MNLPQFTVLNGANVADYLKAYYAQCEATRVLSIDVHCCGSDPETLRAIVHIESEYAWPRGAAVAKHREVNDWTLWLEPRAEGAPTIYGEF